MEQEKELCFILPVYNGGNKIQANLEALAQFAQRRHWNFEIIVANDGSTDHTQDQLDALKVKYSWLKVMSYLTNRGKGYAIKKSIPLINKNLVVLMDSDLPTTIDMNQLDEMLKLCQDAEIVVASRFHPSAQTKRKWHRQIISIAHRFLVKLFFPNLQTTDPDVGFKAYQKETLTKLAQYTNLNHWSWDLQALVCATEQGARIKEFPFHWTEEYETTSVHILKDSISEFCGILYIKLQSRLGRFKSN